MNRSVKRRLYISMVLAILLVLLVGYLSFSTFRKQTTESQWVQHTYQVLNKIESVQRILSELEATRRGYRTTGDNEFLNSFNERLPFLRPQVRDLRTLTEDNKQQSSRLAIADARIDQLIRFWSTLRSADHYNQDEKEKITAEETVLAEDIHNRLSEMTTNEQKLLEQRREENKRSIALASWSLVLGIALILLLVIAMIVLILREFKSRMKAQEELRENLEDLEVANKSANEKNWILTGIAAINDALSGAENTRSLSVSALEAIIKYLDLPAGAFYCFNSGKGILQLQASIALPAGVQAEFGPGEGAIGAAAARREVTVIHDISPAYWQISSALGSSRPDTLVLLPLWLDDELKGVIELASFRISSALHLELLHAVADNLAVAINAADSKERVLGLLHQVQEQAETLEAQQEELRQSNEELTRQSEILQVSEEELRVQEEELRHMNAELEEKNEAVETARQALVMKARELEQNSTYKSEFLANMSHELRTPLNSVLILAGLMAENKTKNLTDKQIDYARIIHKSGTDLLHLINDILDLSKIEAGKIDLEWEHISMSKITAGMQQLFQVVAEEKGVDFRIHIDPGTPAQLVSDQQRLGQVLKNLLSNALKFTSKGGSVSLSVRLDGPATVCFDVVDTGIGIPLEKQKLIFEAFQQADGATTRKYGGTGLGLSISKELVRILGGEMRLQSEPGKGSTFSVCVPLSGAKHRESAAPMYVALPAEHEQEVEDDRDSLAEGDRLILIVEDDADFASLVRDFARDKGYKVVVALRGDDGLYLAQKLRPSAIVLDMNLPVIDGKSILNVLRNDRVLKHIPVHIIAADDKSRFFTDDQYDYSQKPVDLQDLEHVFSVFAEKIKAGFKKVLVLSEGNSSGFPIADILKAGISADITFETADNKEDAMRLIAQGRIDCMIVNINQDVGKGVAWLSELKSADEGAALPVIVLLNRDISQTDELRIKKHADTIIRSASRSMERLMDELDLFLYRLQQEEKAPVFRNFSADDSSLEGRKVLVADDDMRNVFALTTLLEDQGMSVHTAGDGREALEQLQRNAGIDIVLMDIMMPEMDGYTAIREIRALDKYKKLPVIALTAKAMSGDREKSIAAGASDYITKPVENDKLLSLLRVWLAK